MFFCGFVVVLCFACFGFGSFLGSVFGVGFVRLFVFEGW